MNKFQRMLFARLMDEAGDGTEGGAGGGGVVDDKSGEGEGQGKGGEGESGKTKPTDAEAKLLKENLKKKEQIQALSDQLTQATEKLKEFDGLDAKQLRELLAKQAEAEQAELEKKGDYDRLKQRMSEEHQSAVSKLTEQIAALQQSLDASNSAVNELTIGSQFNNSPYIKEKLILTPNKAKALYASHFDLVDGQLVGYDKPRGASGRTAFVDANGSNLPFDAVMTKLVEADPEKDSLLRSNVKPGAGSGTSEGSNKKAGSEIAAEKSSIDRISAGLKGLKVS